ARGKELAAEHGVQDRISFVLTDGLQGVGPEFDTVVIAGMGGETMIGILEAAPWVRENRVQLILQPQSKFGDLTLWLSDNGYAISDAELVSERGKYYVILEVTASEMTMDRHFILRLLSERRDPLLPEYLDHLVRIQRNVVKGVEKSENREQLVTETEDLNVLLQLREETEKWQR
ncbi:MAG: SAM-dependent methyltransferase, partial [Oscillospiraceae bacterium]|nr:SAM-dependent methyltransferase [Oscillospiraceae bacterium]